MKPTTPANWLSEEEYGSITQLVPLPCVDLMVIDCTAAPAQIALFRRKIDYTKGLWCMIGGRIRKGETIVQALQRQADDMGITRYEFIAPFDETMPVYVSDNPKQDATKHAVTCVFPATITGGSLKNEGEEFDGYDWFTLEAISGMELAYAHKTKIIAACNRLAKLSGISFT